MAARSEIIEVQAKAFVAFYEQIMAKYKQDLAADTSNIPRKLKVKELESGLRTAIETSDTVAAHIGKINGDRNPIHTEAFRVEVHNTLYGNYLKAKDGNIIRINETALTCFVLYLSEGNLTSWKEYEAEKENDKSNFIEYTGYFYSFRKDEILSLSMWIDFSKKEIKVEERGFHADPYHEIVFKGDGRKKNNYLFIDLRAIRDDFEDEMKLIAYIGNLVEPNMMLSLFLGTSSYGFPTAGEVVLTQKGAYKDEEIAIIKRYLMLKRSRIRVRNENIEKPGDLRVKRQPLSLIQSMIGTYWVWNYDGKGNIMQSKYTIENDYSSRFFTTAYGENENNQVCLLSISQVINRRLCMSSHPNEGTGVIAYVILNIPGSTDEINSGVFCSVGQNGKNPVSGKIALMKSGAHASVKPGVILKEEIPKYLEKYPKFKPLYKKLQDITKRKVFESGVEPGK